MPSTAENLSEAINYLTLVVDHVASNKKFSKTVKEVSKQAGCGAAGTVAGAVIAGPLGALIGGIAGSSIGYALTQPYDGILQHVLKMSKEEKAELVAQIRGMVGANAIQEFYTWYLVPSNQETITAFFITVVSLAANVSQVNN